MISHTSSTAGQADTGFAQKRARVGHTIVAPAHRDLTARIIFAIGNEDAPEPAARACTLGATGGTVMTVRYFEPVDVPDRLVRVDLDPQRTVAQRLDSAGWVDVPSLYKILLTGENLEWNELDIDAARVRARAIAGAVGVLGG